MNEFEHPNLGNHAIGYDAPLWPLGLVVIAMCLLLIVAIAQGLG